MNFQPLNRQIGIVAILCSILVLAVLFPLLWKLGTVEVGSDAPVIAAMFAAVLIALVLISLLGVSKAKDTNRAFRRYLIYIGTGLGAGIVIYFYTR